VDHDLKLEQ